jgi:hypothetical protein
MAMLHLPARCFRPVKTFGELSRTSVELLSPSTSRLGLPRVASVG